MRRKKRNCMKKRTCTTVVLLFFILLVLAHIYMGCFPILNERLVPLISSSLFRLRFLFSFSNMRPTPQLSSNFNCNTKFNDYFVYFVSMNFSFPVIRTSNFQRTSWNRNIREVQTKMYRHLKRIPSTQSSNIVFWCLSIYQSSTYCVHSLCENRENVTIIRRYIVIVLLTSSLCVLARVKFIT